MSGSYGLGLKALKSFCQGQSTMKWYRAKLVPEMFKPDEIPVFEWVKAFALKHHELPKIETLTQMFGSLDGLETPEPSSYYLERLETRLYYERINQANIDSQKILKEDPTKITESVACMAEALAYIKNHQYRQKIINLAKEGPQMVLTAYHDILAKSATAQFGWPHMDTSTGGLMPGDVVTIIGRPAAGKTWLVLYGALHNWRKGKNVLVVSMEMAPLPIVQRLSSMYAHTNISQLKLGGYSTHTYQKFTSSLMEMAQKQDGFYVVDGNLAASVEDIYLLAQQLKCDQVYIDGAYLLRHPNTRLDKYSRVAENIELIKHTTSEAEIPTVASYQFSRQATKDKKKGESGTLDDIAFSDAIGQVSTIALGLFQDESVETLESRIVRVLKGRNGEIGQFAIKWGFNTMDFDELKAPLVENSAPLEYI